MATLMQIHKLFTYYFCRPGIGHDGLAARSGVCWLEISDRGDRTVRHRKVWFGCDDIRSDRIRSSRKIAEISIRSAASNERKCRHGDLEKCQKSEYSSARC